jgi:phosphatidylinositol alpha 1,6-mannosyltransferase
MLVTDGLGRAAMGHEARASVADCGWRAIGDELLGHYRDVLGANISANRDGDAWR